MASFAGGDEDLGDFRSTSAEPANARRLGEFGAPASRTTRRAYPPAFVYSERVARVDLIRSPSPAQSPLFPHSCHWV
jgi:hypothetical protein